MFFCDPVGGAGFHNPEPGLQRECKDHEGTPHRKTAAAGQLGAADGAIPLHTADETGGTVLNMAILLNGETPVEVTLERTDERKVVFDSRDMDVHGEFTEIEELQQTGDPFDPFALQKACLLACGIIPKEGHSLEEVLEHLGGGFIMHSEVTDVPKGSGSWNVLYSFGGLREGGF